MGKKVVLSEGQFKNYMRRLLKEDTAGGQAKVIYARLAERIKEYAENVSAMGQEYVNLYDLAISVIKNYGVAITNVSEGNDYSGPFLLLTVDTSNVQIEGADSQDYNSVDEWLYDVLEDELYYTLIKKSSLKYFFENINVEMSNGTIKLTPVPYDYLTVENINGSIPENI